MRGKTIKTCRELKPNVKNYGLVEQLQTCVDTTELHKNKRRKKERNLKKKKNKKGYMDLWEKNCKGFRKNNINYKQTGKQTQKKKTNKQKGPPRSVVFL